MFGKNADFIKGIGAGLVAGVLGTCVGKVMLTGNKKSLTRTAGKTMRAVGNIADSINDMLR